ncbi:hybrid sensor histidine kinase/response regulator [Desulfovibrio inopinatus]|uniref:hybrid sensor histidine kinase/response regulator n=1 Tax=Desulfovibrio inopinatus TaxID=102109 RepID=UPI0004112B20|nr:response regulator [Desulfovibrio inopinatus]
MAKTLRWKINGAILVTFAMLAVIFSAVLLPFQQSRLNAAREKAQTLLAAVVSGSRDRLANAVFEDRRAAIRMLMDQMAHVPGVMQVCLFNMHDELLSTSGNGDLCQQWVQEMKIDPLPNLFEYDDRCSGQHCLVYAVPVMAIGDVLGHLVISFSLADVELARSQYFTLFVGLLAAMFVCLIVFLNFVLFKTIIRPLADMGRTMESITKEDSGQRVIIVEENEIGSLARSFNRLLDRLQNKQDTLVRAEKRYRDIFENAAEGIFQAGPTMDIERINPAMESLVGPGPHQLRDLLPEPGGFFELLAKNGVVSAAVMPVIGAEDRRFYAAVSMRVAYDALGNIARYDGSFLDVTAQVEREESERQRRAAEMSTKAKSEFLANMSHEIRTPMNAIIGLSQVALDAGPPPRQQHYFDSINKAGKSLLNIVNDILDYSKIEAGKLSLHPVEVELDDVLTNLIDVLSIPAAQKGLDLVIHTRDGVPRFMETDPVRLGQILINLAGNAVKFTPSGAIIVEIALEDERQDDVELRFSVHDTGIGIAPELQEKLFAPFTQADSNTTRLYGGSGLGLSICKSIIEIMGGKLWLESKPGVGSHFHFQVRFQKVNNAEPFPQCDPALIAAPVLLAIPSAAIRSAIGEVLEGMGIGTVEAEDMQSVQRILEDRNFSLVIFDCGSFGSEGLVAFVQAHDSLPVLPLMPVDDRETILFKACELDLRTVVNTPFTRTSLIQALNEQFDAQQGTILRAVCSANAPKKPKSVFPHARVLVAEDNAFNRMLIKEILQQRGIAPVMVQNGRQAVDAVLSEAFDLVFMDVQMPDMDGLEATITIRAHEEFANLPIVALTANAMEEHIHASFAAGMNAHLTKPFEPQRIEEILLQYLKLDIDDDAPVVKNKAAGSMTVCQRPDLDLDYAKGLIGVDDSALSKLLVVFRTEISSDIEKLNTTLKDQDWDQALKICHAIKGACLNLGALNLSEAARNLECHLQAGDYAHVSVAFGEFLNIFNILLQHLDEF